LITRTMNDAKSLTMQRINSRKDRKELKGPEKMPACLTSHQKKEGGGPRARTGKAKRRTARGVRTSMLKEKGASGAQLKRMAKPPIEQYRRKIWTVNREGGRVNKKGRRVRNTKKKGLWRRPTCSENQFHAVGKKTDRQEIEARPPSPIKNLLPSGEDVGIFFQFLGTGPEFLEVKVRVDWEGRSSAPAGGECKASSFGNL